MEHSETGRAEEVAVAEAVNEGSSAADGRHAIRGFRSWLGMAAVGFLILAGGCAKDKDLALLEPFAPVYAPLPPAVLTGAIGGVLAKSPPFSAHVEEDQGGLRIVGEVFGREGKLVFAPEPDPKAARKAPEELFTFIWHVEENRGYLLNESLQGYAPVSFGSGATNAFSTGELAVERARGLKGFPVSFTQGVGPKATVVKLSRIKLRAAPADLFAPPKGFTQYESPEIMAREVALRRRNLKF